SFPSSSSWFGTLLNPHLLRRPYMQHKDATILSQPEPSSPAQPHEGAIKMSAIKRNAIKGFLLIPALLLLGGAAVLLLRSRESRALAGSNATNSAEQVSVTYPEQHAANGDISLPSTLQAYDDSPIFART